MSKVIGIDLGTTNSCVAVMEGGEPVVIANAEGSRTTPSVVAFLKNGRHTVGHSAKRLTVTDPDRTISSIQREMGSGRRVNIDGRRYAPEEISAMILRKLKEDAEAYLGSPVTDAVITVPACSANAQRQAVRDAGRIAGLEVRRIINGPAATALAYGYDKETEQKIMVCGLGGGSLGVSVLEIGGGVVEVLATAGNNRLGGDDFDECIARYLAETFRQETGIDLGGDRTAGRRLKEAAEKAKADLSSVAAAAIDLPYITIGSTGPKHLNTTLSRSAFNKLTAHLTEAVKGYVRQAMDDAGLSDDELSNVLLAGGSSRIPAVRDAVRSITGKEGIILPDECAAVGAAVQAGIITGDIRGLLVLDVTPLSLGLETVGGVCTRLIKRNNTIPAKAVQTFSTAADNQASVEVHVLQGEEETAAGNESLGRFFLDGIAPAPKGVPRIEVTFDIDVDGMVHVFAQDLGTGKEQHITFNSSNNMSQEEIEKAVREAEQYAAEDARLKEAAEIHLNASQMIGQVEKVLDEMGGRIPADEKNRVQFCVNRLKGTLESKDPAVIKAAADALQQAFLTASEKAYQQTGGQTRPNMGGQADNTKAETIKCFLEIYDNLELAVQQVGDEENVHKKGMKMIFRQMNAVLKNLGVTVENPIGQPFDPHRHDAVAHEINANFGENTVSRVLRKGFLLDGKVIRFASVQVAN